ncbi:hypothetical protein TNCT_551721 [Trichonephila clavata]|uniref:Uncharacterized protein n=1 Tax=Trichonephila clavata TaxID=2740835 RepID=A0A8X6FP92_TRICU|nr:hypothetical protein TNCT_551721 [Trichonephila clavata]
MNVFLKKTSSDTNSFLRIFYGGFFLQKPVVFKTSLPPTEPAEKSRNHVTNPNLQWRAGLSNAMRFLHGESQSPRSFQPPTQTVNLDDGSQIFVSDLLWEAYNYKSRQEMRCYLIGRFVCFPRNIVHRQ